MSFSDYGLMVGLGLGLYDFFFTVCSVSIGSCGWVCFIESFVWNFWLILWSSMSVGAGTVSCQSSHRSSISFAVPASS